MERVKRKECAKQCRKILKETGLQDVFAAPILVEAVELQKQSPKPQTPHRSLSVEVIPPKSEHTHGASLKQGMGLQTHIPARFWGYPKYSSAKLEAMMENQSQDIPRWPRQSRAWSGGSYPVLVPKETSQSILGSGILTGNGSVTPFMSSFSVSQSQLWPSCFCEITEHHLTQILKSRCCCY